MTTKNILIKASAGAGKTYTLATWMLTLLAKGVAPEEIVALTFSRAAAAEIFNKFIERLADAAFDETKAASEAQNCDCDFSAAQFRKLLRRVIAAQHRCLIGTLDSFMGRMVRIFPAEFGLPAGKLAILNDFELQTLNAEVIEKMLGVVDDNPQKLAAFYHVFRLATSGISAKTYYWRLQKFVDEWHAKFLRYRTADWGARKLLATALFRESEKLSTLATEWRELINADIEEKDGGEKWQEVGDFIENFTGGFTNAPTPLKNLLEKWTPEATELTFNYNAKKISFTDDAAKKLSAIVEGLLAHQLNIKSEKCLALQTLMHEFETRYEENVRSGGKLTFADIPRLLGEIDDFTKLDVEYRLDSEFKHWALDEFQDTSRMQWNAISNLVDNAAQDEDRRVFIVGDVKQAIYNWREGDVEIFNEIENSGKYSKRDLAASYRFGKNIASVVNQVFAGETIKNFLGDDAKIAGEKWQAQWVEHTGVNTRSDCVKISRVDKVKTAGKDKDDFITPIIAELQKIRPWERGITCAILVRTNDFAAEIAEQLRLAKIPATFESESGIADTPIISALLNLLLFCEHPAHRVAKKHGEILPLRKILFTDLSNNTDAEIIKHIRENIAQNGLPDALQIYINKLRDNSEIKNCAFTQQRLQGLLRHAQIFANTATATQTLTDFVEYVRAIKQRDYADASTVKLLTIYRSKGLGFDWVIVPVKESSGLAVATQDILYGENDEWLLERPHKKIGDVITELADAENCGRNDDVFENLCVYYVAMTRAKRALSVFLKAKPKGKSESRFFVDHLENVLGNLPYQNGDDEWFNCDIQLTKNNVSETFATIARMPRRIVKRKTPSKSKSFVLHAEYLFTDTASTIDGAKKVKKSVAERGTEIHEWFEKIEWINDDGKLPENPPEGLGRLKTITASTFNGVLKKSADVIDLWREQTFEFFDQETNEWISGIFDRVVFRRVNNELFAEIYDYKSNALHQDEIDNQKPDKHEKFHKRMRDDHKEQMNLYKKAIVGLCGKKIAEKNITANLLLTATLSVCEIW